MRMTDRMSSCGKKGSVNHTCSGGKGGPPGEYSPFPLALEEALAEELALLRELVVVLLEALLR